MLENKRCLVTGASRGIGKEIAIKLSNLGCQVFITATNKNSLKIFQNNYKDLHYRECDFLNINDVYELISDIKCRLGNIEILINTAGIFPVNFLKNATVNEFNDCFNINVRAPFILSKALSSDMIKNRWGRVVFIGSSSSYSGFKETSIYCASKHAVLGLARSLYLELKDYNIRVYCFSPGSVQTDMGRKVKNQDYSSFINPIDVAEYIINEISQDGNMVIPEVSLTRMKIQ